MEDFASILVRDYGLKPQGKSAPMSSTKVSPGVGSSRGSGYGSERKGSLSGRMSGNASTLSGQEDVPYLSRKNGSTKISGRSTYGDDIFSPGNYDDVFGGPPKSSAAVPRYDDVFGEASDSGRAPVYDDLFGGLGVNESNEKVSSPRVGSPRRSDHTNFVASEPAEFDELLPGFSSEPAKTRSSGDAVASRDGDHFVPPLIDDPLITTSNNSDSAPYIDPLDVFTVPPINTNTDAPRASNNASGVFDGFDIFDGYTNQSSVDGSKPRESSQSLRDDLRKSVEDLNSNYSSTGMQEQSPTDESEPSDRDLPTVEPTEAYNISSKSSPFFSFKSDDGIETAAPSVSSSKLGDDGLFSSPLDSPVPFKARSSRASPFRDVKEKWLTVNDMKLVTKPSSVPPPSRPPPVPSAGRYGSRSRVDHMESSGQEDRFTSASWPPANTTSAAYGNSSEEEQTGSGTPGGSRKDFFRRMDQKTSLPNNSGDEKDVEEDVAAVKAREKERQEKERQEKEAKEAEAREEKERERARRYREKEREREKDRAAVQRVTLEARERAAHEARDRAQRSAVERATAEARERAAQQAQERAARERAAVEKANAEARERAEQRAALERAAKEKAEQRAAVERAAAEARERAERAAVERAQAEARERAERAAAERAAVERAAQEARQRAERAAVERAAQEARQRAAAEARERGERERAEKEAAEKAVRERREQEQRRSEHDLDAFFNPGLHSNPPSSEPKRSASVNNMSSMNVDPNGVRRSVNNSRPSSVPSGDYLRSLLEDPVPQPTSNSGEDPTWNKRSGATDRTRERAKQALENIRKREAEMQREQAEKHRAADQLDAEIKRWAAGKEGNLRALLSTLQYVLWPECGWQPVSLSDLITAASVKKTYRKATLFVHPDKVQQKGATVQQKYIAEKVFDLLKEAWNKFNSEELF